MIQRLLDTLNEWDLENRGIYITAPGYLKKTFNISERHAYRLVDQVVRAGWIRQIRDGDYVLTTPGRNKLDKGIKWNEPETQPLTLPILRQMTAKTYPKSAQRTGPKSKSILKSTRNILLWLKDETLI